MPITLGGTALQSSSNGKINVYSKYRKNELQMLTKMIVTNERNVIQSRNVHHRVHHE